MSHKDLLYEENSKLCMAIKRHPCLYNRSHPAYLKKDASEDAWEAIANECGDSVVGCKSRWRNIRQVYARSISGGNRQRRPSNNREYYLSDALQWFVPHIASLNDKSYDSDHGDSESVRRQVNDKPRATRNVRCYSMVEGSIHAMRQRMSDYEFASDDASKESHEQESEGSDRRFRLQRACKRSLIKSPVKAIPHQQPPRELPMKRRRRVHQKIQEPTLSTSLTNQKNRSKIKYTENKSKESIHQGDGSQQSNQKTLKPDFTDSAKQGFVRRASQPEIEKSFCSNSDQEGNLHQEGNLDQGSNFDRRGNRNTTPESEPLNLHMSDDSSRSSNYEPHPEHIVNSQDKINEMDFFFKSLGPYITDMNARQLFNFKKKTYQALMDVFDDPSDFPLRDEVLVNPSPNSLIFENVTTRELHLMRELVSAIVSVTHNSNMATVVPQLPSTPTPSDSPKPVKFFVSKEKAPAAPGTASENAGQIPQNPSAKQVFKPSQPVIGVAKASHQQGAMLAQNARRQQLVPSDTTPAHIAGKVVRLDSKGFENCGLDGERRQYYRIMQNTTTKTPKIVNSTARVKSNFTMTPITFNSTSVTVTSSTATSMNSASHLPFQGPNSIVTPISTNGSVSTNVSASTNGCVGTNGWVGTNGSATNKALLSVAAPAKATNGRRYSISGVVPSQVERRTPTKVGNGDGGNMVNIVTSKGNVVGTRVPGGVQIKRAVRTVMPLRAQTNANNTRTTNECTTGVAAVPITGFNPYHSSTPPALSPLSNVLTLTSTSSHIPYTSTPIFVKTADVLNATPQYHVRNTIQQQPTPMGSEERARRNSIGILSPDFAIKSEVLD